MLQKGLFGKWHLGSHRDFGPKKQGFDEFFGIRDGFIDNYNHYFLHGQGFHDLYEGTKEVCAKGEYFPELMVGRSLKFIEQNEDSPFFLYVAFNIPHYPEQALKQHEKLYEKLTGPRRPYAAVVTTTDHYIGQILDKLEEMELRKSTIIIFMSDNGHSMENKNRIRVDNHNSGYPKDHFYGAHGGGNTGKWVGQKGSFLEGGVRVPSIISYPARVPQGEVRDQIITAMDWYPTVLELCEIKKPESDLDGHSLLPIIDSESVPTPHKVVHFQWHKQWAVREGDWKLIGRDDRAQVSLHNLADDEPEVTNYAKQKPEIVARLRRLHADWAEEVSPK